MPYVTGNVLSIMSAELSGYFPTRDADKLVGTSPIDAFELVGFQSTNGAFACEREVVTRSWHAHEKIRTKFLSSTPVEQSVHWKRHKISLSKVATTPNESRGRMEFEILRSCAFFRWLLFVHWFQVHGHVHAHVPSILGSHSIVFVFSRYHGQ
eukprot:SAG31_NODE_748_length_12390_cov_6.306484_16_plen_153_part_00